ncbi:MAG: PRC-barrel domain-containing protein [Candidatus Woesearchaeota archaeon]
MTEDIFSKNIITSDDILGKDVIDNEGNHVGIITQLHIDKKKKTITGISIDSGFMKPFAFIGIELVLNFGIDAIYISQTPSSHYLGLAVFDCYGIPVGTITSATLDEHKNLSSIDVKLGLFKKVTLPEYTIKHIARNAILNIEKDYVYEIFNANKHRPRRSSRKA